MIFMSVRPPSGFFRGSHGHATPPRTYGVGIRTSLQRWPVEKGIMGDLLIEITSGLKDGQEVVSGPYSALRILKDDALIKRDKSKDEEK